MENLSNNTQPLELNHSIKDILASVSNTLKEERAVEDILFYYSFWLLNFYNNRLRNQSMSIEQILSFIKENALRDINTLGYNVTEEMFKRDTEEPLRSRLIIDTNPHILMALLDSTQEATEVIQKARYH